METSVWAIIVVSILLFFSACSKAVQDTIQHHWDSSIFNKANSKFWNPSVSWKNKYEWFPESKFLTWVVSNPLVSITDAWHLFGFFRDFAMFSCIPLLAGNYWIFLAYPVYRLVFHIFYTYIFRKK